MIEGIANSGLLGIACFEATAFFVSLIISTSYVNPADRERMQELLQERAAWKGFEAQLGGKVVEFKDREPGVRDHSKIFGPFHTAKPEGKGTGMGLSICYGLISEQGGTVRVRL